ncbi:zf-mynd domain-containing protein, partial [Colletotrichum incanum]
LLPSSARLSRLLPTANLSLYPPGCMPQSPFQCWLGACPWGFTLATTGKKSTSSPDKPHCRVEGRKISAELALKELHAYSFSEVVAQFEDKTSYRELEGEVSPNESRDDGNSCKNIPLGDLDVDRLRREFLDRLSETVSSTKGGRHAVASHMFYWPNNAKVFVAINSGLAEGDALSEFLGNLCTALKDIAAAPDNQTVKHTNALWNTLLRHQVSRLNAVIVDLRQIMKSFQHLLPQHSGPESTSDDVHSDTDGVVRNFEDSLKLLAKRLLGDSSSDLERHNSLVSLSHALYQNFSAEHFLALGHAGDKLHEAIGFLGRLKTSFRVLVTAARQISGFDDLSLIPVAGLKTRKKPLGQEWSLAETFHALDLQLSDTAIGKLMRPSRSKVRWTQNRLLNDFSRLKSPTWEVHAEIQLIVFILSHPEEVANGKRFDYIGCSRYSCALCFRFLHSFQALKTRGCHGKLYSHSWTVPLGDNLGKGEQYMLSGAVMKVVFWMRKELITRTMSSAQSRLEAKESTIGGSSIAIPGTSQENRQQSYAASEHLRRQRAQNSHMQSKKESLSDSIEHEDPPRIQTRHETLAEDYVKLCAGCCEVETTRRCSYCGGALFCGKTCERGMPLSHLLKCNMRQVTSAEYLYQDVLVDELPTDPQVQQDYWFDQCQNKNEESHLFGVFAGLVHYHPDYVTREELHQWRSDPGGNPYLVAKVVEKFEELPIDSRGGYFPWFLRHRIRFELQFCHHSIPRTPCPMAQV